MNRRRKVLLVRLCGVLVAIAIGVLWVGHYWSPAGRFGRIESGMTLAELQRVMGRPHDDVWDGPIYVTWSGPGWQIHVYVGTVGPGSSAGDKKVSWTNPSVFDQLRFWLGW